MLASMGLAPVIVLAGLALLTLTRPRLLAVALAVAHTRTQKA
jgi:hypothetical protein